MMNKDTYKRELVRMWNTLRDDRYKNYNACKGVSCNKCPLHGIGCSEPISTYEVVEIVKKWSKENPPKKFKVSQLEYDILLTAIDYNSAKDTIFDDFYMLPDLLEKGYFKGANEKMNIAYYFDNCEVEYDR